MIKTTIKIEDLRERVAYLRCRAEFFLQSREAAKKVGKASINAIALASMYLETCRRELMTKEKLLEVMEREVKK